MAITKKMPRAAWWLVVTIVFTGVVVALLGRGGGGGGGAPPAAKPATAPTISPAEQEAKNRRNAAAAAAITGARQLKASAKDPQTFELKSAWVAPDGSACYEFRAKNSFNAMLKSSAILVAGKTASLLVEGNAGFASAWNKRCTVAGGEDVMPLIARLGLDG